MRIITENFPCPRCNILWSLYAGGVIIRKNSKCLKLTGDNAEIELLSKNLKDKTKKSVVRIFCQNQNFNGSPCGLIHPYILNIASNEKSDKIKRNIKSL